MNKSTVHCKDTVENPCHMCMPLGGIFPFKGIEASMIILHGSQGCATYMRRHIAEHFNEPIDIASSSLNEKGTIYGGEQNLKQGLDNLIKVYQPKLVGVLTTCLAETIGEDIERITAEYIQEKEADIDVVCVSTPGYGDSHAEGYWVTLRAIVNKLARKTPRHGKLNIIVPHISPTDLREIKRILGLMKVEYTLFPDYADTLDRPFSRPYQKIPPGGTRLADIAAMAGASATVEMGLTVEDGISPGEFLEREFGVPRYRVPIPLGLENTDNFINVLKSLSGNAVPDILQQERGRLVDCMIDSHKHNAEGESVVFGDPELVYAVTTTCLENGISPKIVATGSTRTGKIQHLLARHENSEEKIQVLAGASFVQIREIARQMKVNIAIGHSGGKYLTEREGIPLVRIGFPIHDRVGGQRLLSVGYWGTAQFLDRITNTLLEQKYAGYRSTMYRQYYLKNTEDRPTVLRGR